MSGCRKSRRPRAFSARLASFLVLGTVWTAGVAADPYGLRNSSSSSIPGEWYGAPLEPPSLSVSLAQQHIFTRDDIFVRSSQRVRDDQDRCADSCQMTAGAGLYADVPPDANRMQKNCGSRLLVTSLFLCLRVYCDNYHTSAGLVRLNDSCTTYIGQPLPPYDALVGQYSDEAVDGLRRLLPDEISYGASPANLSQVIVPSETLQYNAYDTLEDWVFVHKRHVLYGHTMMLFWIAVVLYGMGSRLVYVVIRGFRRLFYRRRVGYQPLAGRTPIAAGLEPEPEQELEPELEPASELEFSPDGLDSLDSLDGLDGVDVDEAALYKGGDRKRWHPNWLRVWMRRYVTLPAAFGYRCAQDFGWYTVPPRVQSLTIALFVALNVVSCMQGYRTFPGNMYYPLPIDQLYRYVSDRTGIVSYANLPLIWLFGMRNNALMWLTGWDFGTYNNFHRWIARAATVQAIIHSVGYTILVCRMGSLSSFFTWWAMYFWWTGGIATIAMSLLLGLSAFWMRRHIYEVFLVLHIVLSVFVIWGLKGHVSILHGRYDGVIWMCCIIWIGDRVLRVLRILAFNPLFWNTRAKATYDPQTNIVRLVVPYSSSLYQPKPGTFYYIHVLSDRRFWESHPFTVASVSSREGRVSPPAPVELDDQSEIDMASESTPPPPVTPLDVCTESSKLLHADILPCLSSNSSGGGSGSDTQDGSRSRGNSSATITVANSTTSTVPPASPAHAASSMTFLIRPYDGFTGRLRDQAAAACLTHPVTPVSLRVLVDGPYGHSQHFDEFESLLFVVGGSGVVVPLSHLSGIARSRLAYSRLRTIRIVWAVREVALAVRVIREDMHELLDGSVSLEVCVTGGATEDDLPQANATTDEPPLPKDVRFVCRRPDVRGEIESAAKAAPDGRLAVVACGPGRMADDTRRSVVDLLGTRGVGGIEYFEESFQW